MEIVGYPGRSPLRIADILQPLIQDKTVCDIGCAAGDLMVAFEKYAKTAKGIEWEPIRYPNLVRNNLDIVHGDATDESVVIPNADVYYIWVSPFTVLSIANRIPEGRIVVLGDYDDNPHLKYPISGGVTIRFPFNERGREEWWRLTIIQK